MKDNRVFLEQKRKFFQNLNRYKYVLIILLVGVIFLLLPNENVSEKAASVADVQEEDFSVEALETRLSSALSEIDGAGHVRVLLTVESGMKRVFAQDNTGKQESDSIERETSTVIVSTGSGTQETVLVQQIYPQFQGALVVAEGGGDPAVRLKLTEAVAALTGLGADKISICKGK